jgi:glycosyltransferase 2 family protein
MKRKSLRWILNIFLLALMVALLILALKDVSIQETWAILRQLQIWQILALLLLDGLILCLFTSRWWIILRAYSQRISFPVLLTYRQAAFSISYFTPGTQFGGEPFQIHLVRSRHQLPTPTAVASVTLDKMLELTSNFTFLAAGVLFILINGVFEQLPRLPLAFISIVFLLLPTIYLLAIARGRYPASHLFEWISSRWPGAAPANRIARLARSSEQEIQCFFQEHRNLILVIAALSSLTWGVVLFEYWLMASFLGKSLNFSQSFIGLLAARAAFLLPLPAGVGALEGSQVLAMQAVGLDGSFGLSIGLLIRIRDILFGLIGLGFVWIYSHASNGKDSEPGQVSQRDLSNMQD